MKKKLIFIALAMALAFAASACAQADVVGKASITSFNEVLNAIPDRVQNDDQIGGWALTAPDGTVRFIWSRDYSKTANDVMLEASLWQRNK
jgi:opacity protein-like surface antigen